MSNLKKLSVATAGAVVIALGTAVTEKAVAQTLTFEGVGNLDQVGDFYDTAPNDFNIQFSPDALGVVDSDAGGNGNFSNEPSPNTILAFETSSATLNSSVGLVNSLSLSYVAASPTTVDVLDGSGNVLASQGLSVTPIGTGDLTGGDYDFTTGSNRVTVPFSGTAQSVVFNAPLNPTGGFIGIDDISFTPVPEPCSVLGFLTFGVFGAKAMLKRKRGKYQN